MCTQRLHKQVCLSVCVSVGVFVCVCVCVCVCCECVYPCGICVSLYKHHHNAISGQSGTANSRYWPKPILDHSKKCTNRGDLIAWSTEALWLKFSGLVVLKYLFQYPKNHFGHTCTFWVSVHSKWSKIAKKRVNRGRSGVIFEWTRPFRDMKFCREIRKRQGFPKMTSVFRLYVYVFYKK